MKKTIWALLFFTISTIIFFSPTTNAQNEIEQKYPSLFWEISKDSSTVSYLYGTMHSTDKRVHELSDSVTLIFEQCEAVALELIMDSVDMFGVMKGMFMQDTTLRMLYERDNYKKVKRYLKRQFLKNKELALITLIFDIDKVKPMFLSTLVSESKPEDAAKLPLDMYLQEWGKKQNMTLIGIETFEEQMAALDAIPLKQQAEMLLGQIELAATSDSMNNQMMTLYLAQDLDGLLRFYEGFEGDMVSDSFDDALIQKRNVVMAERMDKIMQEQKTFMAVGALHLPGENGVLELLRKKGYQVRPILKTVN
ncbi:MAG: TraB/GumN family protein [Chitinophagales bacterium]